MKNPVSKTSNHIDRNRGGHLTLTSGFFVHTQRHKYDAHIHTYTLTEAQEIEATSKVFTFPFINWHPTASEDVSLNPARNPAANRRAGDMSQAGSGQAPECFLYCEPFGVTRQACVLQLHHLLLPLMQQALCRLSQLPSPHFPSSSTHTFLF